MLDTKHYYLYTGYRDEKVRIRETGLSVGYQIGNSKWFLCYLFPRREGIQRRSIEMDSWVSRYHEMCLEINFNLG
jgi:hypothetical protein